LGLRQEGRGGVLEESDDAGPRRLREAEVEDRAVVDGVEEALRDEDEELALGVEGRRHVTPHGARDLEGLAVLEAVEGEDARLLALRQSVSEPAPVRRPVEARDLSGDAPGDELRRPSLEIHDVKLAAVIRERDLRGPGTRLDLASRAEVEALDPVGGRHRREDLEPLLAGGVAHADHALPVVEPAEEALPPGIRGGLLRDGALPVAEGERLAAGDDAHEVSLGV